MEWEGRDRTSGALLSPMLGCKDVCHKIKKPHYGKTSFIQGRRQMLDAVAALLVLRQPCDLGSLTGHRMTI